MSPAAQHNIRQNSWTTDKFSWLKMCASMPGKHPKTTLSAKPWPKKSRRSQEHMARTFMMHFVLGTANKHPYKQLQPCCIAHTSLFMPHDLMVLTRLYHIHNN